MPQIKANAFASRPIASRSMVISSISKSRRKLFPVTIAIEPKQWRKDRSCAPGYRHASRLRTAPLGGRGQPRKPLYSHYRRAASAKASNSQLRRPITLVRLSRAREPLYCLAHRATLPRTPCTCAVSMRPCKRGSQKTCSLRNGLGHPILGSLVHSIGARRSVCGYA